jgi:hypothetical protein
MPRVFANNAESTVASGISAGATSLTVTAGHGARFPSTGDFTIRLQDSADETIYELVTCTARSTDTLTISATTLAWDAGDKVFHVVAKADLDSFLQSVADNSVTDAKLRDSTALSVIGRSANSTGDPADIAASTDGHVLRRSGTTLSFGQAATAGIADDAVTDAKLRNSTALSVVGRSANSTGDPADIAAGTDGHVLRRSGTALGFGQAATAGIADDAVTYAKMQNVSAASRLVGRGDSGSGDPQEISLGSGLSMSGTTLSATSTGRTEAKQSAGSNASESVTWTTAFASTPVVVVSSVSTSSQLSSSHVTSRSTTGATAESWLHNNSGTASPSNDICPKAFIAREAS